MDARPPDQWHLTPHRSLDPRGQKAFLTMTTTIGLLMALGFALAGLWLLVPFALVAPLGLSFGLSANNRSARAWQDLYLDDDNMIITGFQPGWLAPRVTIIPANWLRVEIIMAPTLPENEDEEAARCEKILLMSRGRPYEIGAFLPPVEKLSLAADLRRALAARKTPFLRRE